MALIESSPHREGVLVPESTYRRTGVILVLAHADPFHGTTSICMVRHNGNPLKGIEHGALGLPSETTEAAKNETPDQTLLRCFQEELGIENPHGMRLYKTSQEPQFEHRFNLDTGLNGDSSNALGYGVVLWTPDPTPIIRSFHRGTSAGIVDRAELSGISFQPLESILRGGDGLAFRRAPNPQIVIAQLQEAGKLTHP